MCGLAFFTDPGRTFDSDKLSAVDAALYHRGPDSGGVVSEPGFSIVFRRLAIMDPRPGSDQPMSTEDGRITLAFNGEIYNFQELREELLAKGEVFRTTGDTEVVLNGYRQWGDTVFDRLEGMFAICLVDRHKGRLVAVRDPLGIKPLYVARNGTFCGAANEVRALAPFFDLAVDTDALPELLTFGWAAGRISNYRGIERVPGGTAIEIDLQTGAYRERRFCDPLDTLTPDASATPEEAQEGVVSSIKAHLMSDVGYSLQLSGGIDSSLVAAIAAENAGTKLDSYAVQVSKSAFDEGEYRVPVVKRYGLNHLESEFDGAIFADTLPKAVRAMEGPVPHGGCVALYHLCKQIGGTHKVVLTGEGADEMFGGYHRYEIWRKLWAQERVDRLWPSAFPVPDVWPLKGVHRLRNLDYAVYASLYENVRAMARVFPDVGLYAPGARNAASARFNDFRDRMFAVDQTAYLESLLVRQDKMSMAHSVEARVPFVHMPLLRKANALPREIRVPGGETKPVLKRLAERFLPNDLVNRRKVGLLLPYNEWARDENGLGRYLEWITEPQGRLRTFADGKALDSAVERFRGGNGSNIPRILSLINMEVWLRSVH